MAEESAGSSAQQPNASQQSRNRSDSDDEQLPAPKRTKTASRTGVSALCPVCQNPTINLGRHVRESHANEQLTPEQKERLAMITCDVYGALAASPRGLLQHKRVSHPTPQANAACENSPPHPQPQPPSLPEAADQWLQEYLELESLPGIKRELAPHNIKLVQETADRLAEAYLQKDSTENLFHLLALPKLGIAPCLTAKGTLRLEQRLKSYPRVATPQRQPRPQPENESIPAQVEKSIKAGKIQRASRTLSEAAEPAPITDGNVDKLRDLHPEGPENPFGNTKGPKPKKMPNASDVQDCINKLGPEVSGGISGWSRSLLKSCARDNSPFLAFLVHLSKAIANGAAPGRGILRASRLTPLTKEDDGLRPVAVGDMIYRVAMKAVMKCNVGEDALLKMQFGVNTPGGVEPLLRLFERARNSDDLGKQFQHLFSVDLRNAFNKIDRRRMAEAVKKHCPGMYQALKWAYGEPSALLVAGHDKQVQLTSSQGVRQGDVAGALAFSLAYRPVLEALMKKLGTRCLVAAYQDDTYVLAPRDVRAEVECFFGQHADVGLELNSKKSKSYRLDDPDVALTVLGSYLGPDPAGFLQEQVNAELAAYPVLSELPAQHALLLIRKSLQFKLRHLMRTLPPHDDLLRIWDSLDRVLVKRIMMLRGERTDPSTQDFIIASIPVRMGGLGVLSHRMCAAAARQAMMEAADVTLARVLPDSVQRVELSDQKPLSQRQRCQPLILERAESLMASFGNDDDKIRTMAENSDPLASAWLGVIPYNTFNTISEREIATGLSFRTLMPSAGTACYRCSQPNTLGHDECCSSRHQTHNVSRHEHVKIALTYSLRQVPNTTVKTEPHVEGRTDRTDLRVIGTASYQQASSEYDVMVSSPFAERLKAVNRTPPPGKALDLRQAGLDSITEHLDTQARLKNNKYTSSRACFHPLIFSSGGCMSASTKRVFAFWQTVMAAEVYVNLRLSLSVSLLRARARLFRI